MHVRFSTSRGTPVVENQADTRVGTVKGILINPDTGKIAGFSVRPESGLMARLCFLPSDDVIAWGKYAHVKSEDRLCLPEEVIRLQPLLQDNRPVLGQRIVTETDKRWLGMCYDVQFDTKHFMLEYIFPRKWFKKQHPVPASDIVLVTKEAIIVKDPMKAKKIDLTETEPVQVPLNDVIPAAGI